MAQRNLGGREEGRYESNNGISIVGVAIRH